MRLGHKTRRIALVVLIVLSICLFLGISTFLLCRSSYVLDEAGQILTKRLERELRHPVSLSGITGNLLTGIQISQLQIADTDPDLPHLVTVESVQVRYKLLALLRRRFLINEIIIHRPEIRGEVDENGQINLAKLVPESEPGRRQSWIRVLVEELQLSEGHFSLQDPTRHLAFDLGGIHCELVGPETRWEHRGTLGVVDTRITLNNSATTLDEFETQFELHENEGKLNELRVALGNSLLTVSGSLQTDVSAENPARLQTRARLHLDLADIQHLLPSDYQIEGLTQISAEASGHLPRIAGKLDLQFPAATMNQLTFDNLVSQVEFTQDELRLVSLSGDIASGKFQAEGTVKLGGQEPTYHGTLQLLDLQLAELVSLVVVDSPLDAQGSLSVHADVSGSQQSPTDLRVTAKVSLVDTTVNGMALRDSLADISIRDDRLQLAANLDEVRVELHGQLGMSGNRDLTLGLQNVNLGRIASIAQIPGVTGVASLTGTSTEENLVEAALQIENIGWNGVALGILSANMTMETSRVFALSSRYLNAASEASLEASGMLAKNMPVEMVFQIPSLQIADFAAIMGQETDDTIAMDGKIRGEIALRGALQTQGEAWPKLAGEGYLELGEMNFGTLRLDPTRLALRVQDSTLEIPKGVFAIGSQPIQVHAVLAPEGNYRFTAQADSVNLAALVDALDMPPLPINAEIAAEIAGEGHLLSPKFDAEVTVGELTYQGNELGQIHLSASLSEGILQCEAESFDKQIQLGASLDTADDQHYEALISAHHWDVTPVLQALGVVEPSIECVVHGQIEATGALTDMRQLSAQLTIPRLRFGVNGQRIMNRQPIQLTFRDERLYLESIVLGDADDTHDYVSAVSGSVHIPLPQQLSDVQNTTHGAVFEQVELASDRILLEHLARWSGAVSPLSGRLQYRLSIQGPVLDPDLQLMWTAPELHVQVESLAQPINVRRLAGRAVVSKQGLKLHHLSFDLFDNPVLVKGNVDANLDSPLESELQLQLSIEEFELGSLAWTSPEISELGGTLDVQADVIGSVGDPEFHVRSQISHGMVQAQRFPLPLEALTATLQLHADLNHPTELARFTLDEASWKFAGADYTTSADWTMPRIEAWPAVPLPELGKTAELVPQLQTYILNNMQYNVHAEAKGIDLVRLSEAATPTTLPLEEAALDLKLVASGTGIRPEQSRVRLSSGRVHLRINGQDWRNTRLVRLGFEKGRLRIRSLQLGQKNPWLTVTGALDPQTQEIEARLKFNAVPITAFIPRSHLSKLGEAADLRGPLTTVLTIGGTLSTPVMDGLWRTRARTQGVTASTRGTFAYRDQQLILDGSTYLRDKNNVIALQAHVPIDLALQPMPLTSRLLDRPIGIDIHARDFRLDPLSVLHPRVEQGQGLLNVDLAVTGTTRDPALAGRISLSDGALALTSFGPPLTDLNVDIPIGPEGIDGPRIRFRMGSALVQGRTRIDLDGLLPTAVTVERARLSDLQIAERLSRRIAASLEARFVAEANLTMPLGSIIAPGSTPWTPNINLEQGLAPLQLAQGMFTIQEAALESDGKKIRNPQPISMSLQNGEMRLDRTTLLLEETPPRLAHRPLTVEAGGVFGLALDTDFRLDVRDLDVHFFSALLPSDYSIHSLIQASLHVGGSSTEPQATVGWKAEDFAINDAPVDQLSGEILYREGRFSIGEEENPVRFSMGSNHAFLVASVEPAISLVGSETMGNIPIRGRLDLTLGDLAILPSLVPVIGQGQGAGEIHVTLGGTIDSPRVWGMINANRLGFSLPESFVNVSSTQARMLFTEQGFQVQQFDGKLNGAPYQIQGFADWGNAQELDVLLNMPRGFNYRWPGIYEVEFQSLKLGIAGPMTVTPSVSLPPIRGLAQVSSGKYTQDWRTLVAMLVDRPSEAQAEVAFDAPIIRSLQLEIDLAVPDEFLVISDVGPVDIELSVLGKVLGPLKKPIFSGRIELLRGDFSLMVLRPQFTLSEGSFIQNASTFEFDPVYEVYAQTKEPLRDIALVTTDGDLRTRDLVVSASVMGRLSEDPIPQFSAQVLGKAPGEVYQLSQAEILSVLVLGRIDPAFSQATASAGQNTFSDFVLGQSQTLIGQQLAKVLGLQGLELDLDLEDIEQSEFTVNKTLLSRLSVTYTSTFELHGDPRIGIEYQILPNLAIRGERDENGKHGVGLTLEREF